MGRCEYSRNGALASNRPSVKRVVRCCLRSRRFNPIRYDSAAAVSCGSVAVVWWCGGGCGGDEQVSADGETTATSMARRANSDSDSGGRAAVWRYSGGGGPVCPKAISLSL